MNATERPTRVLDTRDADLAETTVLDVRKIRRIIGAPRHVKPGLQSMIAEAAADLRRRRLVYAGVFVAAAAVGAAIAQALA